MEQAKPNLQFAVLFLLTIGPLALLGVGISSRFGALVGYVLPTSLCLYGLYGVGYLDNMLKLEPNPMLRAIWTYSPHYRYSDLTQRLYFKSGPLPGYAFQLMVFYFIGIAAVIAVIARLCFKTKR